ncbi:MAG: HAD-IC family P-type ATPase [Bacillota bacterium]
MYIKIIHLLPGRIRLKSPKLRQNPHLAAKIKLYLLSLPGVVKIKANSQTGSLKIIYHPGRIHHLNIIKFLINPNNGHLKNSSLIESKNWHHKSYEEVLAYYQSDASLGLTAGDREKHLKKYGPNHLCIQKKANIFSMAIEPFQSFTGKILISIGILSIFTGQKFDTAAIMAIVGIESVLGVYQGLKANKSLAALQRLATPYAKVIIDNQLSCIPVSQLVPGDIILIDQGDKIPADCRLISASDLEIDEANLTGESIPVIKIAEKNSESGTPLAEQNNMIFMSTYVTKGSGKAIVIATGSATEIGKLAKMMAGNNNALTPLQKEIELLVKKLAVGSIVVCTGVVGIGVLKGRPLMEMIRTGLTLAVGVIPEGLPMVVTIALAFGVQRMAKKNAIIRDIKAVETIGNATVICTDKTGTLTKGEMTVTKVYSDGMIWYVTEKDNPLQGGFICNGQLTDPLEEKRINRLMITAAICNNAQIEKNSIVKGDPTEKALLAAAVWKAGIPWPKINDLYCRQKEIAFDSSRRMMTVICTEPEGKRNVYSKGAVEDILAICDKVYKDNIIVSLSPEIKEEILENNGTMAQEALRVLALAYKPLEDQCSLEEVDNEEIEKSLIFLGLIGLKDPPKYGVLEAVEKCHQANIKVVMITGDQSLTAQTIGREIGILKKEKILTGSEIDKMSNQQLEHALQRVEVCSRTTPLHKLRIVKAFKRLGYIVAMTGDGVNDAPAVKEADIGVAMGQKGTDVTREAATITLVDDNFATIVKAIEEGRNIKGNIGNSVQYVLSGNFGSMAAFILAIVTGRTFPMTPSQIIWFNLVSESIPVLALGSGEIEKGKTKKLYRHKSIMTKKMGRYILSSSIITGVMTFGLFAGTLALGGGLQKARTMVLSNLILNQLFNFIDFKINSKATIGISTGLLLASIYIPGLRKVFVTTPLEIKDWGIILAASGGANKINKLIFPKEYGEL